MSANSDHISDTGQTGFLLILSGGSVLFAIGLSIFIYGLTASNLATLVDKIGVIATGIAMMAAGSGLSYSALS